MRAPAGCHTARKSGRSEEHTSELQPHHDLVCRLLLEKKEQGTAHRAPWRQASKHSTTQARAEEFGCAPSISAECGTVYLPQTLRRGRDRYPTPPPSER